MKKYILISGLEIHNANAMSSTITIGVPAMTAWLGAVHALERKVRKKHILEEVRFIKVAVSYLQTDLQVYKETGSHINSIVGTVNPLDKDGTRASFIEEPRIHLKVSLLIEAEGIEGDIEDELYQTLYKVLHVMKFAGGDVIRFKDISILYSGGETSADRKIIVKLMPGFILIERTDLLVKENDDSGDTLERLLNYVAIRNVLSIENGIRRLRKSRKEKGWLVPIAVGFKGISKLGKVENQRDSTKPHCFVEPIVTLGEFKMAYRFTAIDDIMWHYQYIENGQFYLCVNQ